MDAPTADSQHLRGAPATLPMLWTDEHGEAAAAGGAVTVRVQSGDASDIIVAGSSTIAGIDTGAYTRALTAPQTVDLDMLTATWTDASSGATRTTLHELVGGFYFSVAQARAFDPKITTRLASDEAIRGARREVENECERITGVKWVPRYRRVTLSGRDDPALVLPDPLVRAVRSVTVYSTATLFTTFTPAQLAALAVADDGTITRTDNNVFTDGEQNVFVEYELGANRPPPELLHATKTRMRTVLYMEKSGVPDRAAQFVPMTGGTFVLSAPSLYSTGIPDVDAVYHRYSLRQTRVAGRVVDYDPQRGSLFHGGRQ